MTSAQDQPDEPGTATPRRPSRRVQNAVNKTIRALTTAGAIEGRHAATVELAKLTARRIDAAEDAGAGNVVPLTKQLQSLLAELEPRRPRDGAGGTTTTPGSAIGGRAPADLDGLLGAGPTMGNTP